MALNSLLSGIERPEHALQKRLSLSEKHYQEGLQALARAQQENYTQPQTLVSACESLIKAIQFGRSNPLPYVAMGFLMILINDRDRARRYLLEARRIDPANADAQAYLEFLSRPVQAATPVAQATPGPSFNTLDPDQIEAGFDYDALYEETEAQIIREVRRLMSVHIAPPQADRNQHRKLRVLQEDVSKLINHCQTQIKILDQEFDTGELANLMRPLEQMSRRLTSVREVSKRFIHLDEAVKNQRDEVEALIVTLVKTSTLPDGLQQRIDQILDHVDKFADDLDGLEQAGHDIKPIQPDYEALVVRVEKINEIIEDIQEAYA